MLVYKRVVYEHQIYMLVYKSVVYEHRRYMLVYKSVVYSPFNMKSNLIFTKIIISVPPPISLIVHKVVPGLITNITVLFFR